ncbi:MAG: hypothetical protein MSA93_02975 [Spirochaetales bacterium]|nr:hypothetical protein [Spirochaetales bacterium]
MNREHEEATVEKEVTIEKWVNLKDIAEHLSVSQDKIALLESNFEINRQRIADKCKDPATTVSLEDTDTLLLEIGGIIDDINKIIKANNNVVSEKKTSKSLRNA